jgi:hypothetical protein
VISADERVLPIAEKHSLVLLEKQPENYEFKITGDAMRRFS